MGQVLSICFKSSRSNKYEIDGEPVENQGYSWEKREKKDVANYMFDGICDATAEKPPGAINGQQFVIRNCKNSKLFVFDRTASVSVDDCSDCCILLGPCKGSVFVRDCTNCRFMLACQQFRTRDCAGLAVYLHCPTQPIIEETTSATFACLQWNYPELAGQYAEAEISLFNNLWFKVHDFTPAQGTPNFRYIQQPDNADLEAFTSSTSLRSFFVEASSSLVPRTSGCRNAGEDGPRAMVAFSGEDSTGGARAKWLVGQLGLKGCNIIQAKESNLSAADSERIFGSKKYKNLVEKGRVVLLEVAAHPDLQSLAQQDPEHILLAEEEHTSQLLHNFYSFTEMKM